MKNNLAETPVLVPPPISHIINTIKEEIRKYFKKHREEYMERIFTDMTEFNKIDLDIYSDDYSWYMYNEELKERAYDLFEYELIENDKKSEGIIDCILNDFIPNDNYDWDEGNTWNMVDDYFKNLTRRELQEIIFN